MLVYQRVSFYGIYDGIFHGIYDDGIKPLVNKHSQFANWKPWPSRNSECSHEWKMVIFHSCVNVYQAGYVHQNHPDPRGIRSTEIQHVAMVKVCFGVSGSG